MAQIITNNSGGGGGGAGVYTYKGSVNSYSDLPSSGLKVGYVYNVVNEHTTAPKFPAGSNVAWTGTEWDVLGGTFDLSEYQKKLVEGTGIDIDLDTNEISVDASIVSGASAGATAVQPGDLGAVATSNDYDDLDNKPTIPTVNDATLTIQKNGTDLATFTANASSNVTANISVPTDTNDLTNGAGFITNSALSGYQTTSNLVTDLTSADDTHYPSALAVKNAITAGGNGDVSGPASSVDGDVVLFDGTTGKIIKDSGTKVSDLQEKIIAGSNIQIAADGKTISATDTTYTAGTGIDITGNVISNTQTSAEWGNITGTLSNQTDLNTALTNITDVIPSEATSSNKLADKNYVNDGINSVTAYYITKNANGDQFATYAELNAATTFYSGGVQRTPTRNDYCIVQADENHDNATTRYIYNASWEYQYTVNETALTTAQLNALNSGITAAKVTTYDGYATGKQDKLVSGTNIKTVNGTSVLGSGDIVTPNTTYTAGTGLSLNGTEFSNSGVTSVNGSTGAVTVSEFSPSGTATTGYVVTKTAGGYEWAAPSGGDVVVSSQTGNILTSGTKLRAGLESDYQNLGSYDSNTIYLCI